MRILGLDIGTKRIGVALSDELKITAQGFPTLQRTTIQEDIQQLLTIIRDYDVERIVAGLPKNMDGSLGESAHQVLAFAESVKKATSIPLELWDERLSTVAVTRTLLEADMSRHRRKKVIDKLSAVYILQGYLDAISHSS